MLMNIKTSLDTVIVLKLFKDIKKNDASYNENLGVFHSLTNREKEVLLKYANGVSIQKTSDTFSISIFALQTHWRNIKRELLIYS